MLTIKNDIKNMNVKNPRYNKFILYALLRCDSFSLTLPDFENRGFINIKNENPDLKYQLESLEPFLIKSYQSTEYLNSSRGYLSEIYIYQLNDESFPHLLTTDDLYDWQYPNYLEDLCFYSKGKCWLESIAHEKICRVYTDHEIEINIIKKVLGLKFYEDDNMDVPELVVK